MTRSIRRAMCAGMLVLQAVVLFLTGVVTIGMTDIGAVASLSLGLGLAVLCVLAAGMLRSPVGYVLGWLVQVLLVVSGLWVPMMFVVGAMFAAIWFLALRTGGRADAITARRAEDSRS